jgi:1-acyl-sn-glycerol-3-phosphate acyltransferase
MTPCYGLAECSLALTMTPVPRAPQVDRVARSFADDGRALPSDAPDALEFVSCGPALRGHEVRIVDASGRELEERRQGRIEFRGPSATRGYFDSPEATARLVKADGWLDSGDLGYLAGGELHVTGRIKDVIIRAGRNVYPHELEEAVGGLKGVRKGCVAVFGARSERGTESLVVLAETRLEDAADRADLEQRIRELTQDLLGTPPEVVLLAPPGTVLKTSSGKVRRAACRQLYEEGRLIGGPPPWVQLARLTAIGWVQRAREGARAARETLGAGRFWGAFAPAYAATWGLVASLPSPELRWRAAHAGARAHLRNARVPLTVSGLEHLEGEGPAVIVSNHASYLDGIVVAAALPDPVSVVVKRELQGQAIPRVLLGGLDAIFVERFDRAASASDARQVTDALRAGKRVLVFPEGTCLRMPGLLPFHLGAFQAAAEVGAPVIPMTIRGTRDVLRPDQWFARPGRVDVEVSPPIAPQGQDFSAALALRDAARAVILAACGEPDLGGEDVRSHLGR